MLKFTERPKTPGMTLKKTVLSRKGISSSAGDFVLIWMKQSLMWFNLQRDGTRNRFSNIKETFTGNLQLKMSVICTKVWTFSKAGLSSKFIWWLGKINVNKKYLMRQIPIKMLKQRATLNSSLHNLKIYSSKGSRKTSQSKINICS